MGNTFTVSSPYFLNGPHLHTINDQIVARSSVNPVMPTLPGEPPNLHQNITEVTPGSTTAQIQTAINTAAALASPTTNPVVHIQAGTYSITATLTVPANTTMQIIGDDGNTSLNWTGTVGGGPVMRLTGPSKAMLKNFMIESFGHSIGAIEITNADQVGSRVYMEQATLASSSPNLLVDGLDNTLVEAHDFFHFSSPSDSVDVIGGALAGAGNWQGGETNLFAGDSFGSANGYTLSNGAHVSIRNVWNDNAAGGSLGMNVIDNSVVSYSGSNLYLPTLGSVGITVPNFQGIFAVEGISTNGTIQITGSAAAGNVLGVGLVGPSSTFFSNTSSPTAASEFLNGQSTNTGTGNASMNIAEQNCCSTPFLVNAFNQMRTTFPTMTTPLPSGVTDARLYRVFIDNSGIGIHVEH
jgi:hypothetical protein